MSNREYIEIYLDENAGDELLEFTVKTEKGSELGIVGGELLRQDGDSYSVKAYGSITIILDNDSFIEFDCWDNLKIIDLRFTDCHKLQNLSCGNNEIDCLDVSALLQLTSLECAGNKLRELDLDGLKNLEWLECGANKWDYLEICNFDKLTNVYYANNFDDDFNDDDISSKDESVKISNCKNLKEIEFRDTICKELIIENCPSLQKIECAKTLLKNIEISDCEALRIVRFDDDNSDLNSLTFHNTTALKVLDISDLDLTYLDISGLQNPENFQCDGIETVIK